MVKKKQLAESTRGEPKKKKNFGKEPQPETPTAFPPHLVPSKKDSKFPEVNSLCPGAVFVSRNFFDRSECDAWIHHAENNIGFEYVFHSATNYVAHRECGRIQKDDWAVADGLFARMRPLLDAVSSQLGIVNESSTYRPVGCNGNIRLYKYERGMSFGKHVDGCNRIGRYPNGNTEITVLVYLSSCLGGATRFYPVQPGGGAGGRRRKRGVGGARPERGGVAFLPDAGSILMHVHGDRCLEHEADPVERGVKYVLRTDVVYGTTD